MTIDDKIKNTQKKENFFVGLYKDAFRRKDPKDPNFSRNYKIASLCYLVLFGALLGVNYCIETAKEAKVKAFPTKVVRFEGILHNKDLRRHFIEHDVPDLSLQRYALGEAERLNSDNQNPDTFITPYMPKR